MSDHDDHIRERAYHLWEKAGRPTGRDAEFWHQAREEAARRQAPAESAEPPQDDSTEPPLSEGLASNGHDEATALDHTAPKPSHAKTVRKPKAEASVSEMAVPETAEPGDAKPAAVKRASKTAKTEAGIAVAGERRKTTRAKATSPTGSRGKAAADEEQPAPRD